MAAAFALSADARRSLRRLGSTPQGAQPWRAADRQQKQGVGSLRLPLAHHSARGTALGGGAFRYSAT
eukprot:6932109-Alexandrium_andersonii.AAC.1